VGFGHPLGHLLFELGVLGGGGEIGPLVGVGVVVVEFFLSGAVADVAPALIACGVTGVSASAHLGDDGAVSDEGGIFQKRHEGLAFQVVGVLQAAEVTNGRIEVKQADGLGRRGVGLGDAGRDDVDRNGHGRGPGRDLAPECKAKAED
jgi:hypothetical protein